jgi:hypothetical protein
MCIKCKEYINKQNQGFLNHGIFEFAGVVGVISSFGSLFTVYDIRNKYLEI